MRSIEYTEFQEHQNLYRIVILPILQSFFLRSQRELQMESFLSAVLETGEEIKELIVVLDLAH